MTGRIKLALASLALFLPAIELGVACGSSTETHFKPPPGTTSSSGTSGTGGGHLMMPNLCTIAVMLSDPDCVGCNEMVAEPGGPCRGLEEACASNLGCANDAACVGNCLSDAGIPEPACVENCLRMATAQYDKYIQCIGDNCPACVASPAVPCGLDGGGSCSNGIQDGDETDVDCGGPSCPPCDTGRHCFAATDCTSSVCETVGADGGVIDAGADAGVGKTCQAPTCSDGVKNQGETDVDCGGATCAPCASGKKCAQGSDCVMGVCGTLGDGGADAGETASCANPPCTCLGPSCSDGVKNQDETDVDCGGAHCPACVGGQHCNTMSDCDSLDCNAGTCTAATCSDGVKNQGESDVDCGGTHCPPCVNGQKCAKGSDCQSLSCSGGSCVAATCSDGIKNGTETDVDCGGSSCQQKCASGKGCMVNSDCASNVCSANVCQPPTCNDGVRNGGESDIDCGGPTCAPCNPGQHCNATTDCAGMNCVAGTCQCPQGMIVVPIAGGGIYCIDAVEVTYTEYQAFYLANPPTANQPAYCSWNASWTPSQNWPAPQNQQSFPVSYVNWCQARAYCAYSNKRLCGQIRGTNVAVGSADDVTKDQWYNACTAQGANVYPYGNLYSAVTCNGKDTGDGGLGGPWSQAQNMSCLGGEPGLFDMSGNVAEWEDACDAANGANDHCLTRGGSFKSDSVQLECSSTSSILRDYSGGDVGFRCCL
jgi:hypothetical protein